MMLHLKCQSSTDHFFVGHPVSFFKMLFQQYQVLYAYVFSRKTQQQKMENRSDAGQSALQS